MTKNIKYLVAIAFMLLFVLNDLIFDYICNFRTSDYIAFAFTLLAAIIVFVGNAKIKGLPTEYTKVKTFIVSNFDNAQVVFSVIDIICGLISVISGIFYLSAFVKAIRYIYIPTKILVVINKQKSLIKPITRFSYLWTSVRIIEKSGGTMKNFLKSNKYTLFIAAFLSVVIGVGVYFVLPTFVTLHIALNIVLSVLACVLSFVLVFYVGKDNVASLALRLSKEYLSEDKYNALVDYYNKLSKQQDRENADAEIVAEAEKRLAKEQKIALKEDKKDNDFEAKVQAKLLELKNKKG